MKRLRDERFKRLKVGRFESGQVKRQPSKARQVAIATKEAKSRSETETALGKLE